METTISIITTNLDDKAPVYHQYSRQNQPQPAYIELDCRNNGELMADYSGEIGNAVPMYYWHGLAVRWAIPAETSGDSLRSLFENADFLALCQRIIAGFEEKWDGSNWVGSYSDDASEVISEAETMIERNIELIEVLSAENWLFDSCVLADHWDTQTLEDAVDSLECCIEPNQMVDGDLEEALITQAKTDLDFHPARLNRNHIKTLWSRGEINYGQVRQWLRDIA